jgi:GNAT superfamily N-acetyltransferase
LGDLIIRPYGAEDQPQVLEVLRASLGESPVLRRTAELFAWKHHANPFGPSLVLVAEVGGRIAGVRAMMRWDLVTPNGEWLRCLRPVDTATHPDFSRRGVFRRLTTEALDQARLDGIDLVFNTPNAASGAGYLSMGWREVGPIGVMVRPLFRRGTRVNKDHPPQPEQYFTQEAELPRQWPLSDRASRGLRTPRSIDYLNWRFSSHPTVQYRVVSAQHGMAVVRPSLRSGRKEIVISDLLGIPHRQQIGAVAKCGRAAYLAGWFSRGSAERRAAVAGGLFPVPGFKALTLVALPLRELPINIFDPSNWDLALSDLELL